MPGLDHAELRLLDVVLRQLALDQAARELGSEHRDRSAEVLQEERQGACVVLVAVGDHDAAQLVLALDDVGVVGQDEVDARELGVGEHDAGVHDDHIVAVLEDRHVLADSVEPAERDDPQDVLALFHGHFFQWRRLMAPLRC